MDFSDPEVRRQYQRDWRARNLLKPADELKHGTHNAYTNYGCRCEECIPAYTKSKGKYRLNALEKAKRK